MIKQDCPPHRYVNGRCVNRAARTEGAPDGITCYEREPQPTVRWKQFESETLQRLRDARMCLAKASGLASADSMTAWSLHALKLSMEVQELINEIEDNARRALQEMCR